MKKLSFISILVAVTGICLTVSTFADFYVIPFNTNKVKITSTIVPKTGQTGCWAEKGTSINCSGTGQDGEYRMGNTGALPPSTTNLYTVPGWRGERFTDNKDGTVTDNLTGLIWLKNANCQDAINWVSALSNCNSLASGSCGLTDGSAAGDWRLPNFNELRSLVDPSQSCPSLPPDHPFTNVQSSGYWSSTTYEEDSPKAWFLSMHNGGVSNTNKTNGCYVWPVRSGN